MRRGNTPSAIFGTLQERLAAIKEPGFGKMTARAFILFQSQLSPTGSKYTRLETFPLSSL
jgi:2'-5' RNA ligase